MDYRLGLCNSYLIVDLDAIEKNIGLVRQQIGSQVAIMPVLKRNAYGMGDVVVAKFLLENCGIDCIGVAQVAEAVKMIDAGAVCDYLVIGGVPYHNLAAAVQYRLITPAYDAEYINLLEEAAAIQGQQARVQIKIETGLNRIGVRPGEDLAALLDLIRHCPHVDIDGAFTHFSEAEASEKSYTLQQMHAFKLGLNQIAQAGISLRQIHASNTPATVWLKDEDFTHVRPGGIIYGYDVNETPLNALGLSEAVTWRAFVTQVKQVYPGDSIGYGRAYRVQEEMSIATISVGYGDGYPRHLAASGKAEMLIHGKRAKVLTPCMDQMMLDVTGLEVKPNDIVTLMGADGEGFISVLELQRQMGQTFMAVVGSIADRVGHIYLRDGKQIDI